MVRAGMEAVVGVGTAVGDVAVLVPPCPQAASSTNKKSRIDRKIREEMTWERMVVLRYM
jgi:hypothetical protein